MSYKVVMRAITFRRDLGWVVLLKDILESNGADQKNERRLFLRRRETNE